MSQVRGDSPNDDGVIGTTTAVGKYGVHGINNNDQSGPIGRDDQSGGVGGDGQLHDGVVGRSHGVDRNGVLGINDLPESRGVAGSSLNGIGVYGVSNGEGNGPRVGVYGVSRTGDGVVGEASASGVGVTGRGPIAGRFWGRVQVTGVIEAQADMEVTGDIRLLNADAAENFSVSETAQIEPGTVMVLGSGGLLQPSSLAYDKKVAGVISGAGDYRPGIVLDSGKAKDRRLPVALLGKTYCKVDAAHGSIEIGDLLTTSPTPGHAMKASDAPRAFGAVIGKALCPLSEGRGLIPILIALQ